MNSAPTAPDVVYADTSALVKVVLDERESAALVAYVSTVGRRFVSSALVTVEAVRAVRIGAGSAEAESVMASILTGVSRVAITDAVLRRAAVLEPADLRSLDAIHLATALELELAEMVVYDRRLADAARAHGLTVVSPGA
jgi:predicted nucleic acid-binding protein